LSLTWPVAFKTVLATTRAAACDTTQNADIVTLKPELTGLENVRKVAIPNL